MTAIAFDAQSDMTGIGHFLDDEFPALLGDVETTLNSHSSTTSSPWSDQEDVDICNFTDLHEHDEHDEFQQVEQEAPLEHQEPDYIESEEDEEEEEQDDNDSAYEEDDRNNNMQDDEDEDSEQDELSEEEVLPSSKRRRVSTTSSQTKYVKLESAWPVVSFSGFKETDQDGHTFEQRDKLAQIVEKMGGRVIDNNEKDDLVSFDTSVTHVVAPVAARTPRVIIASLSHKWIMSPEWLIQSNKKRKFLNEADHGLRRRDTTPFTQQRLFVSPGFIEEESKTSGTLRRTKLEYLHAFVEKFGKGTVVNDSKDAKLWLITEQERCEREGVKMMRWNELIHFMYPTSADIDVPVQPVESPSNRVKGRGRANKKDQKNVNKRRQSSSPKNEVSGKSNIGWKIEAEPAPCPFECGRNYTSTIGMKSHLKRFHQDEQKSQKWEMPRLKFQCRYCSYISDRRSNLERHLNRFHINDYNEDGSN
ncbi:DNA damage repair protein BRCT [Acrasis kona]|uniref:DNA damage repair protein BRCT n=1 Tax=Acrasis kona TaxID=1008807 RepID=A0AAW2ZG64_9EUKA